MIQEIDLNQNTIKHAQNILAIHKNQHEIIRTLDAQAPVYAGGYPMALLFAPRERLSPLRINQRYWHDFDIFCEDEAAVKKMRSQMGTVTRTHRKHRIIHTKNASSYTFKLEPQWIYTQIIARTTGSPKDILSSFDFSNCAIGFTPHDNKLYYHEDAIHHHLQGQLEVLDPWMIKDMKKVTDRNAIVQLIRFKKYCARWDYHLGPNAMDLLLDIYNKFPHIKVKQGAKFGLGSGDIPHLVRRNFNLWGEMACLFKSTPGWDSSLDKHGHINEGPENMFFKQDLVTPLDPNEQSF